MAHVHAGENLHLRGPGPSESTASNSPWNPVPES